MRIKTINLAPAIMKSIDKDDIIIDKVIDSDFDTLNNIIDPPVRLDGLKVLRNCSIYHRKCLKAVAFDVTRSGWTPTSLVDEAVDTNKKLLEDLFNDYDNEKALFNTMQDFRTYTHAACEVVVNVNGDVKGFRHIRSTTIRMCKGGEMAVQKVGSTEKYFKILGKRPDEDLHDTLGKWSSEVEVREEHKATSILWLNDEGPDSDYYHEPEYTPAATTIISDDYLRQYNQNTFTTNGVPNYLIMLTGDFEEKEDEETGKTFDEDIEEAFKGFSNQPGTALVFPVKTSGKDSGMQVTVTRISEELKEASFEQFRQSNMEEILAAHEVPPGRLGISKDGALGGAVDVERNKNYNNRVVQPLQGMLDNMLNKLVIKGLMKIEDWKHEYKGLDLRDVVAELKIALELVQNAAMTPAQLLQAFGDVFKLDTDIETLILEHPELDEYYMNGQPLSGLNVPGEAQSILDKMNETALGIMNLGKPVEVKDEG